MDLSQLVSVFFVLAGAASLYGGLRLILRGAGGDKAARARVALGGTFLVIGAALIAVVVTLLAGAWREHRASVFPIHILDLHAPPAAIEAEKPPSPPPEASSQAPAGSTAADRR